MEDKDLQELLDEISRVTFYINKVYTKIINTLQNKNNPNFEDDLTKLINELINLKYEEDDLYSYIVNGPIFLIKAIDYLNKQEKLNAHLMDETARLCFRRILNKLHTILMHSDTEFISIGKSVLENDRKFGHLIYNGVSEEDAIIFYQYFQANYEKSISYRFTTILNEAIKRAKTKEKEDELIKIKLDTTFVRGNELEHDLILSRFTTVKNDLANEIKPSFGIHQYLKDDYLQMHTLQSLFTNISKLCHLRPCNLALQLIFEFKTFILYLSKDNLKIFKSHLEQITFLSPTIKNELLKSIENINKDKLVHYTDSTQISL